MSDVMLFGVLRMPPALWGDDAIDKAQRHARYIQAADEIERLRERSAAQARVGIVQEQAILDLRAEVNALNAREFGYVSAIGKLGGLVDDLRKEAAHSTDMASQADVACSGLRVERDHWKQIATELCEQFCGKRGNGPCIALTCARRAAANGEGSR